MRQPSQEVSGRDGSGPGHVRASRVRRLGRGVAPALLLGLGVLPFVPGPTATLWVLSTVLAEQSLAITVVGVAVALPALVLLLRRGRSPLRVLSPVVALIVAVAGTVPATASAVHAGDVGTEVSWGDYFSGFSFTADRGPDTEITLGRAGGTTLHADLWDPVPGSSGRTPTGAGRPVVVMVHGGSWDGGRRSESPRWNQWLNGSGAAVLDVDYRLTPGAGWKQQPRDVACALAWVNGSGRAHGLDPGRVVLMGSSAGAHLALLASYGPGAFPSSCGGTPAPASAVVGLYPPTDLTALEAAGGWRHPEVVPDSSLLDLMGSAPAQDPAAWRQASPVTLVGADSPPTLLLHGDADQIVPVDQSRLLVATAQNRGADVELAELPFANHSYDLAWGGVNTQVSREVIGRFLHRTVGLALPSSG